MNEASRMISRSRVVLDNGNRALVMSAGGQYYYVVDREAEAKSVPLRLDDAEQILRGDCDLDDVDCDEQVDF